MNSTPVKPQHIRPSSVPALPVLTQNEKTEALKLPWEQRRVLTSWRDKRGQVYAWDGIAVRRIR